jgi:hypothetical protein
MQAFFDRIPSSKSRMKKFSVAKKKKFLSPFLALSEFELNKQKDSLTVNEEKLNHLNELGRWKNGKCQQ